MGLLAGKKDFGLGKTYLNYAPESAIEKNEKKKPKVRNPAAKRILGDAFSNSSNRISIDIHKSKESAERKALTSNRMFKEPSSPISSEQRTQEQDNQRLAVEVDIKNNLDLLASDKRLGDFEQRPEFDQLTYKPTIDIDSLMFKRHNKKPRMRPQDPDQHQEQSSGSHPKTEEKKMNSSKPSTNAKAVQPMARLVPNSLARGPPPATSKQTPLSPNVMHMRNPLHKPVPRLEVDRVAASPPDPNDPNAPPETSETVKCIEFEVDRMIGESRSRSQNRGKHR